MRNKLANKKIQNKTNFETSFQNYEEFKCKFDFSEKTLALRNAIDLKRRTQSNIIVMLNSLIGSLIISKFSDSTNQTAFEAYYKASKPIHNVACGSECPTNLSNAGFALAFPWLLLVTASGQWHTMVNLQGLQQDDDFAPMTPRLFASMLFVSSVILTAMGGKNAKLDFAELFDGIFDVQDFQGRFGFSQAQAPAVTQRNAAEYMTLSLGHNWSVHVQRFLVEFKPLQSQKFNEKVWQKSTQFLGLLVTWLSLLINVILYSFLIAVFAQFYKSAFKSTNGSQVESQYKLWHISNTMTLQHMPESRQEKAFLMIFTAIFQDYSEQIQGLFETLLNKSFFIHLGMNSKESAGKDLYNGFFIIPLIMFGLTQSAFALILKGGVIDDNVLKKSTLGFWDLGTKLGNGTIWPDYIAGKQMIMFLYQPARQCVLQWQSFVIQVFQDPLVGNMLQKSFPDNDLPQLFDFDEMKCQDQLQRDQSDSDAANYIQQKGEIFNDQCGYLRDNEVNSNDQNKESDSNNSTSVSNSDSQSSKSASNKQQ